VRGTEIVSTDPQQRAYQLEQVHAYVTGPFATAPRE